MKKQRKTPSVLSAMFWKLMERFGVQFSQFVLQLILARLLDPAHYGALSMMVIFTTLANVFIQRGFNTALIQNKDVTEEDYSSVFWLTLGIATVLYIGLFALAPVIATFYDMPDLVRPFRVLCLVLFPGAFNSIQLAGISRKMDFKKIFRSNVAAILVAGTLGIVLAYSGAGLWALVAQNLANVSVACIVMWFSVRWRPRLVCNWQRIRVLFSYGWKLLVSSLIDTVYQDLRSLIIGKKYDSAVLGYYNRGKHFPQFIIHAVNSSVQSVMLSAMSAEQDQKEKVKALVRNSIMVSSFIIFPMMAGLAGTAEPLVKFLLTDKWLPCVPYLQIYCFTMAFYPVHSCNLQAINAMGRSDIFLKLEVVKKVMGVTALVIALVCFDSPIAIAMTGIVTGLISSFLNAFPNKKLIGYAYTEQIRDILPALVLSLIMLVGVRAVLLLQLGNVLTLVIQVVLGVAIYVVLSVILKIKPFKLLLSMLSKKKRT